MFRQTPTARRRYSIRIATALSLGVAIAASAIIAAYFTGIHARERESRLMDNELRAYGQSLQRLIDRYRVLPTVLALDPELRAALESPEPLDAATTRRLNIKLEQANGVTHLSTLSLLDRQGNALAANNWRDPSGNVGQNYGFRPYFRNAIRHGSGDFYGIGVSTLKPGYYIAEAIRDQHGEPIGVIVAKISLDEIKHEWNKSNTTLLLSDEHDIVFLSSNADWMYRELHPMDNTTRDYLSQTRQYLNHEIRPSRIRLLETLDDGTRRIQLAQPITEGRWLWRSMPIRQPQWTLHQLQRDRSDKAALSAAAITLAAWLPIILLGLFIRQRIRLNRLRQHSRHELERMVAHHAESLRSTHDKLIDAARQATEGQSRSLEHLPQGISVVDADMRLVAWNSRYREIFDFPDNLLQAGRPIEDLLRYNAKRGWLSSGSVDESIERRIMHLRSGNAHIYERKLPNGTILEIHGNPLPEGGFVTSFADITTYKTAARDLRTLVSSLEKRIQASTQDLREAKASAESVNHYKARFIASAVHDLMQPANAARMLLEALHHHPLTPPVKQLIDLIENVLNAQDSLLSSLLDISRLEAGALQPRFESIALAPLLSELAIQSEILAHAHGLELHWVPAHCTVHSDPTLLRRVLQNFLSNAIQYTSHGRVLLGCRRGNGKIRIEVWDTGIGIPENKYQMIFKEFERLDNGIQRDARSAGLGLSIVQRIALLLGHEIGLRSRPGHGSVFSIEVPLSDETPAPLTQAAPTPATSMPENRSLLRDASIWCLDDDPHVLAATRALLESWGCRVAQAHDQNSALSLMDSSPPPDLILLDYQLGDITGLDVLRSIAAHWPIMPAVLVVSAQRDETVQQQIAKLGYRFLAKPVSPAALRAMITHLLTATSKID
ncbi:MAG: PAS-domain containing protein [Xanthomonadaceae bacterium]|jgi:histidine kinase|nr:PAS-domain containing protein [Xanthomonadaceae bacterium]